MDPALIKRIIEAALLAAGQPLSLAQINGLFPEEQAPESGLIERALESLREESSGRGVELVEVASGFRFQVRDEVQPWVGRLWAERQTRYSRAQLETLALIAYRQPITRGEIEQIRGVTVSSHIVRTLEDREWIRVVGHRDVPGRPALFGTTRVFLDYFNLKSLDQLPPLSELRDIPDFDPQLSLEPAATELPQDAFIGNDAVAVPDDINGLQSETAEAMDAGDPDERIDSDRAENHAADTAQAETADHMVTQTANLAAAPDGSSPDIQPDTEHPTTGSQADTTALPEHNS